MFLRSRGATRTPTSAPPRRATIRSLPYHTRNFTVLMFWIGLLVLAFNAVLLGSDPNLDEVIRATGIVAVLFGLIAASPGVRIRRGQSYLVYKFWEYPFIVGLVLVPSYAVTTVMIATVALQGFLVYLLSPDKRTYVPMHFGIFAVSTTIGTTLAITAPPWTYPLGYAAVIGSLELFLYGYDLTQGDRRYAWRTLTDGLAKRLAVPLGLSATVTLMVIALREHREIMMFAPLSVVVLNWFIQHMMNTSEQTAASWSMNELSQKFIAERDENRVIAIALEESLKLFQARRAEIVLNPSTAEAGARWSLAAGPGHGVRFDPIPPGLDPVPMPAATRNTQVIPLTRGDREFGYALIEWDPLAPERRTRASFAATFGNTVAASVANARQDKQQQVASAEKAREAEHDPLTGLGNRAMLRERGPGLLAESQDIHRSCALLLFDLDGFKRYNDTLGHAAGDEVLIEVARRIKATTRRNDLAIRLGGDEFAILAVDLELPADAERLAYKITKALMPPVEVHDIPLSVESSIGVAIYPNDAEDIETLLKLADIAMYQAKNLGRGKTIRYAPKYNQHSTEALTLATDLRRAIHSTKELVLHYQPQVNLRTGHIVGVEALVRWDHPRYGLLYPDRFVDIAEGSNSIRPFTLAIIDQALRDRQRMREVLPHATVSVNLSAQNLLDTGLPIDVKNRLDKYGIDPTDLVLEVTETTAAKDAIAAARVLGELADLGCIIAMDDFGSGYATLESMRSQAPIREIKIDRGFIKDIVTNDKERRVTRAIIDIVHAHDCRVVAEGVEDLDTYHLLHDMDCDIVQGYLLHKPAPLDVILDWAVNNPSPVGQFALTDGTGTA